MKNNFKKGFTLIELLVVIAIIGILAAVVLASLNSARSKGADAAVKANLSNARVQAELYYDTNGSYSNVCTAVGGIGTIVSAVGASEMCYSDANRYIVTALLPSYSYPMYWCIDSAGTSAEISTAATGVYGDIPCYSLE